MRIFSFFDVVTLSTSWRQSYESSSEFHFDQQDTSVPSQIRLGEHYLDHLGCLFQTDS
jgi:hypothetical protein